MRKILSIIMAAVMIFCLMPPVRSFAADTKTVEYIDYVSDGKGGYKEQTKTAKCTVIGTVADISELSSGWYVFDTGMSIIERININGNVHFILTDDITIGAKNGIHLSENNTLNIYGQSKGTGLLKSDSTDDTAIGGNRAESCGTLNIYGGQVYAASNYEAAIGGGFDSGASTGGNGGTINVYGGELRARSSSGAAIGGGFCTSGTAGNGSKLSVYGGKVIAESASSIAIGKGTTVRGKAGNNGETYISGGSVSSYSTKRYGSAFDHLPAFGAGYAPRVIYGESDSGGQVAIPPESESINYTHIYKYNYVSINSLYVDTNYYNYVWDGLKMTRSVDTARCIKLDSSYLPDTLESGWYYFWGWDTDNNKTLTINGDVKLIVSGGLEIKNIVLPKGSTLTCYCYMSGYINAKEGISDPNGSGGTLVINSGSTRTLGSESKLGRLMIYAGNMEFYNDATCPDIRMYGYQNYGGILEIKNGTLSSVPKFIGYVPKAEYKDVGASEYQTVIDPPSSFYTKAYEHLRITMDHSVIVCDHSGNTNTNLCEGGKCSVCGADLPAVGHTEAMPVVENSTLTTCTENGSYDEVIYCSVCGKELSRETKVVETSGHTPDEPVIENETAALCTESGTYDEVVYCHVCGIEISRETKTSESLGHTEGKAEVSVPATTSSTGTNVYRCVRCGIILRSETTPVIKMDIPTNTGSSNEPAQVIYTEFPELRFDIEIRDGKAMITWDGIKNADKYVVYAIQNGKMTELEKTKKTSFETDHNSGTGYLVRYMKNGVLSPKSKSVNENVIYAKPMVTAASDKNSVTLRWQDMSAEKYNIYKYIDGKAVKIGTVKGSSVKIKNLTPDTEYKFIVTAVIDGKETAMLKSDIVTVKTKQLTVNS